MIFRRLVPGDAALWRDIRLEALQNDPPAFATRYEEIADRPLAFFAEMLAQANYHAGFDGGRAAGVMGWVAEPYMAARHRAMLISVYIRPAWRGTGAAGQLLHHALADAARHGIRQMELGARAGDPRAVAFYKRHGFRPMGTIPDAFHHDGQSHDELLMFRRLDA
ncbi:hypothetical protein JT55_15220 [Rhodovulum sp. NI22]|uniref:GNAT family N-acetyltransferase n=1 Tax=Actibacterium sp. TaxID=1872125 RepID=UPI00050E7239|nr:N-acetyltransferase [Actibacterium sp.]KGB81090.1 hypothetical protein JT55_15220 [Rhodovulum sp. NI22]|tara:strand:+ start:3173 stop:3667 length:495 start_codon:yes stop_codon:yes gene_type:complete